jgi:hypothetical protein
MDDLVEWLRAQLDEDERVAQDALKRATTTRRWIGGEWVEDVVQPPEWRRSVWEPARVLREIDAKRQLLADLSAEQHEVVDDCWYTCAAATDERDGGETCDDTRRGGPCDCGRDKRVARRLRLFALPYADRPGYREEWRP